MFKLHPRLLKLIELVELVQECVIEILNVSSSMQCTPWFDTSSPLTRLENE